MNAVLWHADIDLPAVEDSEWLAQRLAPCLVAPLVMTLSGEIGAGKTTIVRGLLRALGVQCRIKSPTFSMVETYDLGTMLFHHFDMYRIVDMSELEFLGFREYFQANAVCCLEWPERIDLPDDQVDLALMLTRQGEGRQIRILARGQMVDVMQRHFKK